MHESPTNRIYEYKKINISIPPIPIINDPYPFWINVKIHKVLPISHIKENYQSLIDAWLWFEFHPDSHVDITTWSDTVGFASHGAETRDSKTNKWKSEQCKAWLYAFSLSRLVFVSWLKSVVWISTHPDNFHEWHVEIKHSVKADDFYQTESLMMFFLMFNEVI